MLIAVCDLPAWLDSRNISVSESDVHGDKWIIGQVLGELYQHVHNRTNYGQMMVDVWRQIEILKTPLQNPASCYFLIMTAQRMKLHKEESTEEFLLTFQLAGRSLKKYVFIENPSSFVV